MAALRSWCTSPAFEKRRSTPPDVAGSPRYSRAMYERGRAAPPGERLLGQLACRGRVPEGSQRGGGMGVGRSLLESLKWGPVGSHLPPFKDVGCHRLLWKQQILPRGHSSWGPSALPQRAPLPRQVSRGGQRLREPGTAPAVPSVKGSAIDGFHFL